MAKLHPTLLKFVEETYGEAGLNVVKDYEFSTDDPTKQVAELGRLLSKGARRRMIEAKLKELSSTWKIPNKALKVIDKVGGKVVITVEKDEKGEIIGFTLTAKGGTGGGGERKSYKVITPEGKELNFSSAKQMREGLHKAIGYRTPQVKTEDFIKKLTKEGYKVTEL